MSEASQAISLILYRCLDDPGVYSTLLIGFRRGFGLADPPGPPPLPLLLHLHCCRAAGFLQAAGNRPSSAIGGGLHPAPLCATWEDTERDDPAAEATAVGADCGPRETLLLRPRALRMTPVRQATELRTFISRAGLVSNTQLRARGWSAGGKLF